MSSEGHGSIEHPDAGGSVRLGAYAARSCAVRAQWDVVRPREPAPDSPFRMGLAEQGIAFEEDVVAELVRLHPDAVLIDPALPRAEREARTLAALADGARIVVGPRLPHDPVTGRVGAPDLLVRRDADGASGATGAACAPAYVPVDIKHHRTVAPDDPDQQGVTTLAALGQGVPAPRPRDAGSYDAIGGDLLQLAHYWRMLETLGHAHAAPLGAIVGRERTVVWFALDEPRFAPLDPDATLDDDPSDGLSPSSRASTLERYDVEYAERVRVARTAAAHVADPSVPLARVPVWFGECPDCPWREHCGELLAARQDVSLLPRVGLDAWEALARVGADTMPALAALPDGTRVEGMSDGAVAHAVAQARARLGADVAYRRPGVDRVTVERGDVELDVDMENVEDGAYLWGVHVSDRVGAGLVAPGYHAFVDWDADAGVAGARAFAAFWAWLGELRAGCDARGLTLRAYCWHAPAENGWLRRGAEATGVDADEVEAFIDSEQWVDLLRVFDRQLITGHGRGLKVVAPMLGFAWVDDDPSGGSSMRWWEEAVDPDVPAEGRERLRARLLAYNADDVRATLHVREWLDRESPTVREVPRG